MRSEATRIHLIRHGQVAGFEQRRYNGQADVALTRLGMEQSRAYSARLTDRPLAAIYSSDLSRTNYGAKLIAAAHHLSPIQDTRLRELHIGDWEGLTWEVIQRRWPVEWRARLADLVHVAPPGGESLLQMASRVRIAFAELRKKHHGQEVAIVAHGGVNRVLLLDAIGAPLTQMFHLEQGFGCYNIVDYWTDGNATVQLLNG